MDKTLVISLTPELQQWIQKLAQERRWSEEEVAEQQLEMVRLLTKDRPWLEYVGSVKGAPDLSMREGFESR